jgi:hypothetical protein
MYKSLTVGLAIPLFRLLAELYHGRGHQPHLIRRQPQNSQYPGTPLARPSLRQITGIISSMVCVHCSSTTKSIYEYYNDSTWIVI